MATHKLLVYHKWANLTIQFCELVRNPHQARQFPQKNTLAALN